MDGNTKLYTLAGIIVVVCVGAIFITSSFTGSSAPPTQEVEVQEGEAQVVMLGLGRQGYEPQEITVKAGVPVTLKNDGTLQGCAKYPLQAELGLRANFAETSEYTFIPTKKGTFNYACSMGMYKGTIKVV